jgi:hypothetical protein
MLTIHEMETPLTVTITMDSGKVFRFVREDHVEQASKPITGASKPAKKRSRVTNLR